MTLTLIVAAFLAGLAGFFGVRSVLGDGKHTRWTSVLMLGSFCFQLLWLGMRGELRGSCPLMDAGEILVFLAWSLTLFYLMVGAAYRVMLLGMFSAPLVMVMLFVAMLPGLLDVDPVRQERIDYWGEMHSAISVLSYGAMALGAVSAVMLIILDRLLKSGELRSGLFRKMPPIHTIIGSVVRLTVIGVSFLSVGLGCGFMMGAMGGGHLWVALAVWVAYAVLLGVWFFRGMTPKRMSVFVVVLFVASLSVFAVL